MRELLRLKTSEQEMSGTILSAFYDIDMFYKQDKSMNKNTMNHLNCMLDQKAVGSPVTALSSSSCSFAPGFLRRNSTSNMEAMINSNKFTNSYYGDFKENPTSSSSTATMNKENRFRDRAYSETGDRSQQLQMLQQQKPPGSQINSTRYKTELCRPYEENGACKYGEKCQFAHGYHELRNLSRHPKYKTEPCRTFHTIGFCPYGPRCHFIHNADERRPAPSNNANTPQGDEPQATRDLCGYGGFTRDRPRLHHSLSFSGFSSHRGLESPLLGSPTSRTPPPSSSLSSGSPSYYEDILLSPSSMSSCVNGAFTFPGQDLRDLLAPLAVHTQNGHANNQFNGAFYGNMQANTCPPSPPSPSPPTYNMSHLQSLRRLNDSPVFDSPPSPPDSLSDRDSYASGSLSSAGSLSGSESPSLDAGKRLPIFSRLSISDD
ncbi:hypothetical protein DPEC_G00038100 [Dallia pectoralis]|uniref:Uncharacterized protein n=1 Tax=Dallia pectoralis TaxID=75939 RepID=A0ACC2HE21_DALPE|nr:hypothetical protein DPEC_G00038100 [Dallia pectoralis]